MTVSIKRYELFLNHGDFADLYLEDTKNLSIRWEEGDVESITSSEEGGVGLRFLRGLETRFGHTDLDNPIEGPVTAVEMDRLKNIQFELGDGFPPLTAVPAREIKNRPHAVRRSLSSVSMGRKILALKRAFEAASVGPHVRQVTLNYGEKLKKILYLNSLGESYYEERTYVVFNILVVVEKKGEMQTATDSMGGLIGLELFDGGQMEILARMVGQRAQNKLYAPLAPVGPMPVVIAASAGGTLIHEAVGHSLEADAVLDGSSPAYQGKIGQVVGHQQLNVYDDPTLPFARGSFHFDDEGVPSERTLLIENGVLKNYLYDRLSARRGSVMSNGHGRRESFAHRPIPRMSNTFIAPGRDDPNKIIANFRNGLLVTKMGGGQVNTATGDFIFEVEEGYHLQDGEKKLVRGATLLGNGPEVLKSIEEIGSDHGWGVGTCGKEGQGVPVSDAIPTIRIKSLVVGGTAEKD